MEQFDKLDRNSDGSLDLRELSGVGQFGARPDPNAPNANRDQAPNIEQFVSTLFERYDADNDGKLSEKESADLPERGKEHIMKANADNDGTVTKEELTAGFKREFDCRREGLDRERPSRPESDN